MKHYMKLKTSVKEIRDEEIINLIREREVIDVGAQVIVNIQGKEILLEVVEINNENVYWMKK